MHRAGDPEFLAAKVPGSVYGDLLAHGKMEDPFYRDNETKALALMEYDYEYSTTFDVARDFFGCDEVLLHFDGLDTLADLTLNGRSLGSTNNMHRVWEFSVKQFLKPAQNKLNILFHSPTKYIAQAYKEDPMQGSSECMRGFPLLRKTHCMFGWDWGPRLPDAGIWRPVQLVGVKDARLESVYARQNHHDGVVDLEMRVDIRRAGAGRSDRFFANTETADYAYRVEVFDPDGKKLLEETCPQKVTIQHPRLWWPHGYGEQPLYTVKVTLLRDGTPLDIWQRRYGLRTMTMTIAPDAHGKSFAPTVNGVQIFAMGADYIPEDNLFGRVTPQRTRSLLEQCIAANYNFIRVWGGGYYPSDDFYDTCDELGLLVWQDFMFACAVYHLTPEFEENIRAEFVDNIRRLRHHASLGLWCGNNEMEQEAHDNVGNWWHDPLYKSDYIKMYEYLIPHILRQEDPQTFYWPSSPSSGGGFDDPQDPNRGDVHYWTVWHGNVPFPEYRKYQFRFLSEFGFQSFPALKTVETYTKPEDRNIFSYVMEKHQRNTAANGKIMNYLEQTYLYPNDFDTLLYASQLLQADAIRYGVEHFRRSRGVCMGTIYWQVNDCWPVASWASIDYCGRWKALHYAAKRFYAPIMLSCQEEGMLTQDPSANAQPYELKKSIRLCVANETMQDHTVTVRWALRDADAGVVREGCDTVVSPKLSSTWLAEVALPEADPYTQYVSYEAEENGEVVSGGTVLFSMPKFFHFADPKLTCHVEGDEIVVEADAYARCVEIRNASDDMLLSDNFFDMNAGTTRVKVLSGKPEGLTLRSVYNIR
jgi:beta-mannosidase